MLGTYTSYRKVRHELFYFWDVLGNKEVQGTDAQTLSSGRKLFRSHRPTCAACPFAGNVDEEGAGRNQKANRSHHNRFREDHCDSFSRWWLRRRMRAWWWVDGGGERRVASAVLAMVLVIITECSQFCCRCCCSANLAVMLRLSSSYSDADRLS